MTMIAQFLGFQQSTYNYWNLFQLSIIVAFICGFITLCKYALFRRKYSKLLPGRKTRFFDVFGNTTDFYILGWSMNGFSFNVFMQQVACGYYELFRKEKLFVFWGSFAPFIGLTKAESAEAMLSGTKMMQKSFSYDILHSWLGTGLLTSHGAKWKSRRKLLTPCFHFDILKDFLPVFNEQSQILVKCLRKEIDKDFIDITMPITLCSLDIICETTLGVSVRAQENSEAQYVKSVIGVAAVLMERLSHVFLWWDFIFNWTSKGKLYKKQLKTIHNFTRSVIQEKKEKLLSGDVELSKRKRKALLDSLLEHHIQTKDITEEDIREEVDTFAFEGHDTTSMGMTWALYLIGLHKDVQEKIHEELDRIFGEDTERPATTDDLHDMNYLDRVLKESLRLYPSVPAFARVVNEDIEICGYPIPKGATVGIVAFELHRDPDVFPDPEKFDPDRFLPEQTAKRHPYAYIPFSAGPRNCIGQRFAMMEEKVVLSAILRNYTIESLDPRDRLPPSAELITRAPGPIRIKFKPRHLKKS